VEWTFLDNPYFQAGTVRKRYTLACEGGSASKVSLDTPGEVLQGIKWRSTKPPRLTTATHRTDDEEEDDDNSAAGENGASQGGSQQPGMCDLTLAAPSATGGTPSPATSIFNMFKKGTCCGCFDCCLAYACILASWAKQ
jgi:hypothetical protein